jgi:hypothetical protein
MLDPATLSLIASTVAALSPLLGKAVEKAAEKIGELTITGLIDKFKNRVPEPTKQAVNALEKNPANGDRQGSLRVSLEDAIEADPELATFLKEWLAEAQPVAKAAGGVSQTANVTGDNNITTQIAGGSGNNINIGR